MNREILDYIEQCEDLSLIAISGSRKGNGRLTIRPISIKGQVLFQAEKISESKAYHYNIERSDLIEWLEGNADGFRQYAVYSADKTATFLVSKKGRVNKSVSNNKTKRETVFEHDKAKEHIIGGGIVPALVDLGVTTAEGTVIKSKSDKFRQIDRFVRIIDEAISDFDGESFTVLDFGCGKSYLTFILYWYFVNVRHKDVKIIGYDLKKDVVDFCNATAEKYGYNGLHFYVNDVNKAVYDGKVDMIISLHACDTATDAALDYAIKNKIKYIFSVPCCQHEINSSIVKGGDLDIFMTDGILKDRMCALLTDAVRIELLRQNGYEVGVLEFVEFAHSPKNLMIKAVLTNKKRVSVNIDGLCEKYGFTQTLNERLKKD